jgi:hypothetical protein
MNFDIVLSDGHKRTDTVWPYLEEISRLGKFLKTERGLELRVGRAGGKRKVLLLNVSSVSVWGDEIFWK